MIILYIPNIFFCARVQAALELLKREYRIVDQIPRTFDWLIMDLTVPDGIEVIKKNPGKVVCFCSHMRTDLIDQAKALGCNVHTNGYFSANLQKIVGPLI